MQLHKQEVKILNNYGVHHF